MKKLVCLALAVVMLLCCGVAGAEESAIILTLDEFIANHNAAMDLLEMEEYYGYDAHLNRDELTIETGEINDTILYTIDDQGESFIILIMPTGTTDICQVWASLPYAGADYKAPRLLLENMCSLLYGSGFVDIEDNAILTMYELGLYEKDAFAYGTRTIIQNAAGTMEMLYESSEINGLFFAIRAIED